MRERLKAFLDHLWATDYINDVFKCFLLAKQLVILEVHMQKKNWQLEPGGKILLGWKVFVK